MKIYKTITASKRFLD